MRPVITPEESKRLDESAADPVGVLMERAGLAVALEAVAMGAGYGDRVVVLAGVGNNGGDGYVAARFLAGRGVAVEVQALGYPRGDSSPARRAALAAWAAGVKVTRLAAPSGADLVIDSVFGVGFRGRLPDGVSAWTGTDAPVLAVDIPSGLHAGDGTVDGTAFTAERTVTFHARKPGHILGEGPDRCGEIVVADIGLVGGEPAFRIADDEDAPVPRRRRTAHKWSAGSVLVVGGSEDFTGAPYLAATAALHAGAGAVAVACPEAMQPRMAAMAPDVITYGLGAGYVVGADDVAAVLRRESRYDTLVLGPGLGSVDRDFVLGCVLGWSGNLVVDADGLNALGELDPLRTRTAPTVITPHAGELSRLTGGDGSPDDAATAARRTGAAVLLKGNPTFVFGEEAWVVDSGGPELATAGTGDVLAGMIGAFWSSGMRAEEAARSAAYHHGVTGARLAERGTFTASELAIAVLRRV